ncbi:Uncharacterised protein [Mycobacteroides abscessus subsp. massiliense]|nr:Uncharacterised protein [Mycobacteroides abscessus subsp. massiliense]
MIHDIAEGHDQQQSDRVADLGECQHDSDLRCGHGELGADGVQERLGEVDRCHRQPAGEGEQHNDGSGQHACSSVELVSLRNRSSIA